MLFYIGQENCSGIKTHEEEEFFEYVEYAIDTALKDGYNVFEIDIKTSHDPSLEDNA